MTCERCHKETNTTIMSWFNTQTICMDCSDVEKENPNYNLAKEVETKQVQSGNFNYKGLFGIPDEELHEKIYP